MLRPYGRRRNCASRSSVELAARGARGTFALVAWVGLTRFFGVVAALFAAADTAMGPEAFENQFGGGSGWASVFAIVDAKLGDVLHQALDF